MKGILTGKGINAQREMLSSRVNHDEKMADLTTTSIPPVWLRAVVVDVMFDPAVFSKKTLDAIKDVVKNPDAVAKIPRNSIIARVVSNAEDKRDQSPQVFYPMMSHTHEPIKPGEHVWVMFEDPSKSRTQGFWLSRIVEPSDVDDPNYTHADRKFGDKRDPTTIEMATGGTDSPDPTFPNGGNTEESLTLAESDGFETIVKDAIANKVSTYEPVPRYSKRPGDWAAEGSNNALLVLGTDRTGASSKLVNGEPTGFPQGDKAAAAGMFDLVVGRGRKLPPPKAKAQLTAPRIIKNSRGNLETDKSPVDGVDNPSEGDPDFENDAARVYGAMDTDIDKNFGKPLPNLNAGATPTVVSTGSGIIAKADHLRSIVRKDGTIRIIKEGDEDKDRAVIIIEPDGTIMIDSQHIIIGSGIEKDNGAGEQVLIGRDATESMVLGDTHTKLLNQYTSDMKAAIDGFCQSISAFTTFGNFGLPVPDLVSLITAAGTLKTQVDSATQSLQSNIDTAKSKVGKLK